MIVITQSAGYIGGFVHVVVVLGYDFCGLVIPQKSLLEYLVSIIFEAIELVDMVHTQQIQVNASVVGELCDAERTWLSC